jgi:hypothetical protein
MSKEKRNKRPQVFHRPIVQQQMKICKRGRHAIRYAAAASDPLENHQRAAFRKWNRIRKQIFFVDQKKTNGSLLGIKKEEKKKKLASASVQQSPSFRFNNWIRLKVALSL